MKSRLSETKRAIGQLAGGAFFFAKRSCEHLKVPQHEKGGPASPDLETSDSSKNGKLLSHSDPQLEYADCISNAFQPQKKEGKTNTITQTTAKYAKTHWESKKKK